MKNGITRLKNNESIVKSLKFKDYIKHKFEDDESQRVILRRLGKLKSSYGIAKKDDILMIEVEEVYDSYMFNVLIYEGKLKQFISIEFKLLENQRKLLRTLRKLRFTKEDYFEDIDRTKVLNTDALAESLKKRSIVKK